MINPFDTVKLKRDLINVRDFGGEVVSLKAGSIGTVVMIYDERVGYKGKKIAYEVDFCDSTGDTVAIVTLAPDDIELFRSHKPVKQSG